MKFDVFNISDPRWGVVINEIPAENKDIYFLQEWYKTWLDHENSEAYCIYAEIDGYKFLYPFLKRCISNYELDKTYYDIQSAYGYGGIISQDNEIPSGVEYKLNQTIDEYLCSNNIIAEFIRDHPLIKSIKRRAEYSLVRRNVFITPTLSYKVPNKQARQNIEKAEYLKLESFIDHNLEHLDRFIELYALTAHRINMSDYYRFNQEYFDKIKFFLLGMATLIHVRIGEKIIAGGLLLNYQGKASLHLTASDDEYFNYRPNDFLYNSVIRFSIENQIQILNLGGGLSPDPNDTLFRFKSKYSDYNTEVFVGKNIINPKIYSNIIEQWSRKYPDLRGKYVNYFLKYQQLT